MLGDSQLREIYSWIMKDWRGSVELDARIRFELIR
jgi:hypothetical protein